MRARRALGVFPWARAKSVFTSPGAIALTRTFFGPHSAARLRTRWWSAALETAVGADHGAGKEAADRAYHDEAPRLSGRLGALRHAFERHRGEPQRASRCSP